MGCWIGAWEGRRLKTPPWWGCPDVYRGDASVTTYCRKASSLREENATVGQTGVTSTCRRTVWGHGLRLDTQLPQQEHALVFLGLAIGIPSPRPAALREVQQ